MLGAWLRVLHLDRPVARAGDRPGQARRVARLPLGVRDAHRGTRVADRAHRVRARDRAHPRRHRCRPDLHAHAGHDGPDGGDDRRVVRRPAQSRSRRLPSAGGRGLARPDDRPSRRRDARVRADRARDPARRGSAGGGEVEHGVSPRGPRSTSGDADLHRGVVAGDARARRRDRRRRDAVAVQPELRS